MAKSIDNILLKEASGTIGGLITLTRKASGAIVMGKKRRASSAEPTPAQLDAQRRFKVAIQYAKTAIKDPVKKAGYQTAAGPDQSAFNMAFKDAAKPPVIESIDTADYQGAIGDAIVVRALDDFKVVNVKVSIRTAAGVAVETGDAIAHENGLDWTYTATAENAALAGSVVTAVAFDTPGNQTPKEVNV